MTEIKILIYTDTKDISLTPDDPTKRPTWSVSILRDVLEAAASPFVKFSVEVVNRYEDTSQPRKIDAGLLNGFDQLWMFGKYQCDFGTVFTDDFGGPENELREDELKALEEWMTTHGVLIAGDHSDMPPARQDEPDVPDADFLCLGAALGQEVPRAGELRRWVGPPTSKAESSFDTLVLLNHKVPAKPGDKDDPDSDALPQQYLLELFGPAPSPMPHPLLIGKDAANNDTRLDLFPDHIHEGEVIIPSELGDKWPPAGVPSEAKPRPVVIARGCDKRRCASRAVLALYDPPEALKAGRILADSTWHHYLNINIRGLRDSSDDTAFRLLQQYYRHAAFFLAPLEKRQEVTGAMLDWMLHHPEVWEAKGNEPLVVGKVALSYLSEVATRYEITEMLQQVMLSRAKTDDDAEKVRAVDFPEMSAGIAALPAREFVVGHIINSHYKDAARRQKSGEGFADAADADPNSVAAAGVKEAFRSHKGRLAEIESVTETYLEILDGGGSGDADAAALPAPEEADMAHEKCLGTWEKAKLLPSGGGEKPDGEYEIREESNQLKGKHRKDGKETTLEDLECDGTTLSFSRVETRSNSDGTQFKVRINYNNGTITGPSAGKFRVKGQFVEERLSAPLADTPEQGYEPERGESDTKGRSGFIDADTGDWQAEKPAA